MTILDKIIEEKKTEVALRKEKNPLNVLQFHPYFKRQGLSMKENLLNSQTGIISEFKRKSPSKGWIHEHASVVDVTEGYDKAGACGISILTDFPFFGGTPQDLTSARPRVNCPILRKDFMIDPYQLYEAKAMGADVILLIASALSVETTKSMAARAHELGLEVLLEIHDESELGHICDDVDMVGVNNRNLKTFEVSIVNSLKLVKQIPDRFVKVSESGISSPETVKQLREAGFKGFLMGENFMKNENPSESLANFLSECLK